MSSVAVPSCLLSTVPGSWYFTAYSASPSLRSSSTPSHAAGRSQFTWRLPCLFMTFVRFGPSSFGVPVPPASPAPPLVVPLDEPPPEEEDAVPPELEPPDEDVELLLSSPPHAATEAASAMPTQRKRELMGL